MAEIFLIPFGIPFGIRSSMQRISKEFNTPQTLPASAGRSGQRMELQQKENDMGDRGNIIVKEGNSTVYLYTHWTGSNLPGVVSSGLKRGKSRWNDGQYLARILFCEMVRGDEMETTGYGISSTRCDGGTDILVDVDNQTVSDSGDTPPVSFASYVEALGSQAA